MNQPVELREIEGGGQPESRAVELSMYPSLTGVRYQVGNDWDEEVERGAFRRTLGHNPPPDVILRLEHAGLALASTRAVAGAPTLALSEDERGLHASAQLAADDPDAQLLKVKARQAPLESSFAFRVTRQTWSKDFEHRTVHEVDLHRGDVAITGRGASPQTQGLVSVRGQGGLERRKRRSELIGQRFASGPRFTYDETEETESTIAVARSRPVAVVSYVDIARARRAKLFHDELRASSKYSAAEVNKFAKEKPPRAFLNPDGHGSYPVLDAADLSNAVRAIGRGNASHEAIRRFVITRARELRLTKMVPASWAADGSLQAA